MTLILTLYTRRIVLQVSDLLVTDTAGRTVNELANKSIVYQATDARVALCFSGAAYIDSVPTDMWLAFRLAGREPKRPPRDKGLHMRSDDNWLPLNEALGRLARDLQGAKDRRSFPAKYAPIVSVGGFQAAEHGRRRRRVWTTIEIDPKTGRYEMKERFPREDDGRRGLTATPSGWLTGEDITEFNRRLTQINEVGECEREMARLIQRKANEFPAIGKDCMSVLFDNQAPKVVGTRFLPGPGKETRWALTPAFVWPGIVQSPLAIWGANSFMVGDVRIDVGSFPAQDLANALNEI